MSSSGSSNSNPFEKLDARLVAVNRLAPAHVTEMVRRDEPLRSRGPGRPLPIGALHGIREEGGQMIASVLIRFGGDKKRLDDLGAKVAGAIGEIVTADVPLPNLGALAADPDVMFVELDQPLFPLLDRSVEQIGAKALHDRHPTLRGRGVVIGVVDIGGFDIHHPDFWVPDSSPRRTRIRHYWDQTGRYPLRRGAAGRLPDAWQYGVEYGAEDIERDAEGEVPYRVVDARPIDGHGTHVAGIAAGNGCASGGTYTGVAPAADIVLVNLANTQSVSSTACLCHALEYVFDRAKGRPCVVNLSVGTRKGPRNGTSNIERAIDEIVRTRGRAVVVAAGNDGARKRDAHGKLPPRGATLSFKVYEATTQAESIEIWYPGSERLRATIITPRGEKIGPIAAGGEPLSTKVGLTLVTATSLINSGGCGDNTVQILIQPDEDSQVAQGIWKILLEHEGAPASAESAYHATLTGASTMAFEAPSNVSTLTSPGTAEGAITVANYLHRDNILSATSSQGPTRDGRRKPDLAAPGGGVRAARWNPERRGPMRGDEPSDLYYETLASERNDTASGATGMRGGQGEVSVADSYMPLTGTSMAAPHVTGLIALIYEARGAIPMDELKALLREHADKTGLASAWDPGWGYGRSRAPHDMTASSPSKDSDREDRNMQAQETKMAKGIKRPRGGLVGPTTKDAAERGMHTEHLQIDIGNYVIYKGTVAVGEVFVREDPEHPGNQLYTEEHWCLYSNFEQPSRDHTSVSLRFEYDGTYASLEDYLVHVRTLSGYRYIRAACTETSA